MTRMVRCLLAVTLSTAGLFVGATAHAASPAKFAVGDFATVEGHGGTRVAKLWVTLSDPFAFATSVGYSVTAGSATANVDFKPRIGALAFQAGVTKKPISVTLYSDAVDEGDETFTVTLGAPTGGPVLGRSVGTGTIIDDDPGSGLRFDVGDASVVEGDTGSASATTVQIPINLNGPATVASSVSYAVTGVSATAGVDFTPIAKTLPFNIGQYKKYVTVKVKREAIDEENETFRITLSAPLGASLGRSLGTGTIIDDDAIPSSTSLSSNANPAVEATSVAFTATVSSITGTPTGTVTFKNGSTVLGTAPLVGGSAVYSSAGLPVGTHAITAVYGGDGIFGPSTSPVVDQIVTPTPLGGSSWGLDADGQLGSDATASTVEPEPYAAGGTADWVEVSSGRAHKAAIRSDGTLWTWGANLTGALGQGDTADRSIPTQVGTGTDWVQVSAGSDFTLALRTDGTMWGWGANSGYELGLGNSVDRLAPVQIGTATDWAAVSAGSGRSAAISTAGDLYIWGHHSNLGPTGILWLYPAYVLDGVVQVSAGFQNTLAIRTDGTLWAQGTNDGVHGDGSTIQHTDFVQSGLATDWGSVSVGAGNAFAVKTDGTLWGWGANNRGQLYDGTTAFSTIPVQIGGDSDWAEVRSDDSTTKARKQDGSLWTWGENPFSPVLGTTGPVALDFGTAWATVDTQNQGSIGLRSDGSMWVWGRNSDGQVGPIRSAVPVPLPGADWRTVSAGNAFSVGVKTDGTLWAWGTNTDGQLGDGSHISRTRPGQVGLGTNWVDVAAGSAHVIARRADGTLWAWGRNSSGQVGDGTTTERTVPVQIGSATDWASFSAGGSHNLALKEDGTLLAWGANGLGQLANGNYPTNQLTPMVIDGIDTYLSVAAGENHSLAVRSDGTLWSWGSNFSGQLGIGSLAAPFVTFGQQIGTATNWAAAAAGPEHSLATRADGTLWSWGANGFGQLGDGTLVQRLSPIQVGTSGGWTRLAAGGTASMAIRSDGSLWSWGYGYDFPLGLGTTLGQVSTPTQVGTLTTWEDVVTSGSHTLALHA